MDNSQTNNNPDNTNNTPINNSDSVNNTPVDTTNNSVESTPTPESTQPTEPVEPAQTGTPEQTPAQTTEPIKSMQSTESTTPNQLTVPDVNTLGSTNAATDTNFAASPDDELVKAFIGKNYDKITKKGSFNVWAFFFGPIYLFYRKMIAYGFLYIGANMIVSAILTPFTSSVILYIISFAACTFLALYVGKIYLHFAKQKVAQIKAQNPGKSTEELKAICTTKGGTSTGLIFLGIGAYIGLFIVAFIISFIIALMFQVNSMLPGMTPSVPVEMTSYPS